MVYLPTDAEEVITALREIAEALAKQNGLLADVRDTLREIGLK